MIKKFVFVICVVLISLFTNRTQGQSSFALVVFLNSGREHNIFKSPDVLYDLNNEIYIEKDSILSNSFFTEQGYDARYRLRKKNKFNFEVGNELWRRNYFDFYQANQTQWDGYLQFQKIIGKKLLIESKYTFAYKDKLGTSISGDELLRSYKYYSHTGEIEAILKLSDFFESTLMAGCEYNNYFADTTQMPLTHTNFDVLSKNEFNFNEKNSFEISIDFRERNYLYYMASDKQGNILTKSTLENNLDQINTLRQYRYFSLDLTYNFKPYKGMSIAPGFSVFKRGDLYQEYYSYKGFSSDLRIRYLQKKWYAYFFAKYRMVDYKKRYAFTYIELTELLKYQYLNLNFKLKYKFNKKLKLIGYFSNNFRYSNTELDYSVTRRSYYNYEFSIGLNYTILD